MNLLKHLHEKEKMLLFLGGAVTTLYSLYCIKSGKAKKIAVKSMATGIQLQRKVHETFQNIKEEAVDIVHDADEAVKFADSEDES